MLLRQLSVEIRLVIHWLLWMDALLHIVEKIPDQLPVHVNLKECQILLLELQSTCSSLHSLEDIMKASVHRLVLKYYNKNGR